MSLGILGTVGLGVTSTIPGECWDQPGFKDCHAMMYANAAKGCVSQGQNNDGCIVPTTDKLTMISCPCTRKSTTTAPKPPTTGTFKSSSSSSSSVQPFTPEPTFLGMSLKTVAIVVIGAYAIYSVTEESPAKKKG